MNAYDTQNAVAMFALDANRDPLTGAPGAHPMGTGVGAASGAAAGVACGAFAGPIGAAFGLVFGAVAGGLAGKAVAEKIDPTAESAYWEDHFLNQGYVDRDADYETYQPAYRAGYEGRMRYAGMSFDEAEAELRRDYEESGRASGLSWEKARRAARDAWNRASNARARQASA